MSNHPLVSTIIPFLNAEKFIQETIESVFAQTYDNWELFLIDDGSTDGSTEIARDYAEKYPEKVRYLEHENHQNRGVCVSRNLGIRHAQGTYIAPLDADDVWFPDKLEQQVAIMESQPEAGMIYGRAKYWYGWTGIPEDMQRDFIDKPSVPADNLYKPPVLSISNHPLGKIGAPCPSDLLLRREVLDSSGGFEEDFLYQVYEDQAFLAKVYLSVPVFVSSQCWIKYRLRPDSCCGIAKEKKQENLARLYFLNWLEKYLSEQEVKDIQVWKALNKALLPYRHPILYRLSRLPQWIGRQILPASVRNWLKGNLLVANK